LNDDFGQECPLGSHVKSVGKRVRLCFLAQRPKAYVAAGIRRDGW
jgi:hypothetical protein